MAWAVWMGRKWGRSGLNWAGIYRESGWFWARSVRLRDIPCRDGIGSVGVAPRFPAIRDSGLPGFALLDGVRASDSASVGTAHRSGRRIGLVGLAWQAPVAHCGMVSTCGWCRLVGVRRYGFPESRGRGSWPSVRPAGARLRGCWHKRGGVGRGHVFCRRVACT